MVCVPDEKIKNQCGVVPISCIPRAEPAWPSQTHQQTRPVSSKTTGGRDRWQRPRQQQLSSPLVHAIRVGFASWHWPRPRPVGEITDTHVQSKQYYDAFTFMQTHQHEYTSHPSTTRTQRLHTSDASISRDCSSNKTSICGFPMATSTGAVSTGAHTSGSPFSQNMARMAPVNSGSVHVSPGPKSSPRIKPDDAVSACARHHKRRWVPLSTVMGRNMTLHSGLEEPHSQCNAQSSGGASSADDWAEKSLRPYRSCPAWHDLAHAKQIHFRVVSVILHVRHRMSTCGMKLHGHNSHDKHFISKQVRRKVSCIDSPFVCQHVLLCRLRPATTECCDIRARKAALPKLRARRRLFLERGRVDTHRWRLQW
jgi:hypothetical protein